MSYSLNSGRPSSIYRRCLTLLGTFAFVLCFQMIFQSGAQAQERGRASGDQVSRGDGGDSSNLGVVGPILVNPANTQGWATSDTRPGGAVSYVYDAGTPSGVGALQLTTDGTTAAKADYFHAAVPGTTLASVSQLSYYTRQVSGPAAADPSYQIPICATGGNGAPCNPDLSATPVSSFTTLIYEPYLNPAQGAIVPGAWQFWDVDAGMFYSSRTVTCSGGTLAGGAGSTLYTLAQIKTICPGASVLGYGVNIGTFNPNYIVETDLFNFNGNVYNFEPNTATIVVDDDGLASAADCNATTPATTTIQGAVTAANPGDTIKVCPGTYPEQVLVNKTLTILGPQAGVDARTATRSTNLGREAIVTGVGNAGKTPFYVSANNVTINGFTIQGATDANNFGYGILLAPNISGSQILNNIVQNNIIGLGLSGNSAANQTRIEGNFFRYNNQPGPASGFGIYTDEFLSGGTLTNVLINENGFTGNDNGGIGLLSLTTPASQSNITISNNDFIGNGNAINVSTAQNLAITGNSIAYSQFTQVFIDGTNGLTFTCNTVAQGASRGIRFSDFGGGGSSNIVVNNNNFVRNALGGIVVETGGFAGTGILNAENNYYGSPTGPTIASNPGGTGDAIIDQPGVVDYQPFLTTASLCAPVAPPTAASVTVSGRVVSEDGRAVRSARVTMTDPNGVSRSVATGSRGSFTFDEVEAGKTYTLMVGSRRYSFDPVVISVTDNLSGLELVLKNR